MLIFIERGIRFYFFLHVGSTLKYLITKKRIPSFIPDILRKFKNLNVCKISPDFFQTFNNVNTRSCQYFGRFKLVMAISLKPYMGLLQKHIYVAVKIFYSLPIQHSFISYKRFTPNRESSGHYVDLKFQFSEQKCCSRETAPMTRQYPIKLQMTFVFNYF